MSSQNSVQPVSPPPHPCDGGSPESTLLGTPRRSGCSGNWLHSGSTLPRIHYTSYYQELPPFLQHWDLLWWTAEGLRIEVGPE